ncbi:MULTISPECIES: hypothetical protein [unclassified Moorena]|uniref:hypothetical protein n=1 Tax=unclassified Moorena TaxID=2683338 RepID=UPI001417A564|nr:MULTISPECIES: hypothetical protein [unclassified Moorena]NEO12220.1 hypothetical protein [Moorena sp. SIO3E8]
MSDIAYPFKAKGKRQKAKGKRQKAKGKRQKAKGKRQKAKGNIQDCFKRCSAVLGRQRGLGGLPHERLPWFPRGLQGADAGSAHRPKTMSDCIKTGNLPQRRLYLIIAINAI